MPGKAKELVTLGNLGHRLYDVKKERSAESLNSIRPQDHRPDYTWLLFFNT